MALIRQAGAVAVRREEGGPLVLLVRARRDPRQWIFPKGHIEPGEDAGVAALRELAEEAGVSGILRADLGSLEFTRDGDRFVVHHYLVDAREVGSSPEGRETRWLPANEARTLLTFDDARILLDRAVSLL